jgi:hypothetical protein
MAKKETPKADALANVLATPKENLKVPEYAKPWEDFKMQALAGQRVRIVRRSGSSGVKGVEGVITRVYPNCFYLETDEGDERSCPWWAVHDWEVLHQPKEEESL